MPRMRGIRDRDEEKSMVSMFAYVKSFVKKSWVSKRPYKRIN